MDDLDAARLIESATADFQKTFEQQSTLTQQALDFNQTILLQHQAMVAVLNKYERSAWPWVRWIARAMHEEMMARIVAIERAARG